MEIITKQEADLISKSWTMKVEIKRLKKGMSHLESTLIARKINNKI